MRNVITDKERRDSWFWLFLGGAFAVCVVLFVYNIDRYLSTSPSEKILADNLREIRSAQSALPSTVDSRQLGTYLADERSAELDK